jgi:hypothetical protein
MGALRQVFADFARLGERPGLGLSVQLGREDLLPDLATLEEGEHVLLIEPDNLCAEGLARFLDSGGHRYWFGVQSGLDAIRDIHPETLARTEAAADPSDASRR